MSLPVHKLVEFQIHKVDGRIEASAEMHWYASTGYYRINLLGFGKTEAKAKQAALDMAITARTALHFATIENSSNRVSETTESAGP